MIPCRKMRFISLLPVSPADVPNRITPESGFSSPRIRRNIVVFPFSGWCHQTVESSEENSGEIGENRLPVVGFGDGAERESSVIFLFIGLIHISPFPAHFFQNPQESLFEQTAHKNDDDRPREEFCGAQIDLRGYSPSPMEPSGTPMTSAAIPDLNPCRGQCGRRFLKYG